MSGRRSFMRWLLVSIAFAIILSLWGIYVNEPDNNLNISQKVTFWFTVCGFLLTEFVQFCVWVRKRDL